MVDAGSSSSNPYIVDDDEEDILSDAEQLQLQEALMFSLASSASSSLLSLKTVRQMDAALGSSSSNPYIIDDDDEINILSNSEQLQLQEAPMFSLGSSSSMKLYPNERFRHCDICLTTKIDYVMFRNKNVCDHFYCRVCIIIYVTEKIKMNITKVTCPDPNCEGVIGPDVCRGYVPSKVLNRWEDALCESVISGFLDCEKFYCPFKDCSALLVNDGCGTMRSSECPYCHRFFCARCKIVWHAGLDCVEFKSVKNYEIEPDDIMLMNLAKRNKWKRCPKCMFFVEKGPGCKTIECRCGLHFCYTCGRDPCACPYIPKRDLY